MFGVISSSVSIREDHMTCTVSGLDASLTEDDSNRALVTSHRNHRATTTSYQILPNGIPGLFTPSLNDCLCAKNQ